MADFKPLPENPTNADLALSIYQLHECLETETEKSNKFRLDTQKNFDRFNYLFGIKDVETDKLIKFKPRLPISYWRIAVATGASISAVTALYKISMLALPGLLIIAKAIFDGYK